MGTLPHRKETMTRQRLLAFLAVATAATLGIGGLVTAGRTHRDDPATTADPATPPVRVVLPGRPGESAAVTDSDRVRAPDGSTYNSIDTTFVRMMIIHHEQAIRLSSLAAGHAGDARVLAIAQRIGAAQGPEVQALRGWLATRGLSESDPDHDHTTMPGMQPETQIQALAAAKGIDFDRRFITMMSAHHQGAIAMASDVLAGGTDQAVSEIAKEMAVEQSSEIRRMQQLGIT